LVILLPIPCKLPGAAAESNLIEEFTGGLTNATLEFYDRLWDSSLAVELPRGSTITRAELEIDGIPRPVPANRHLDFTNLTMSNHLWARENIGVNIYPPRVDPYANNWPVAVQADLQAIASDDGDQWHTETDDDCRPPYEWPVQLYHFNPVVPGATSIEIVWHGYGYNMVNTTTNFHDQMWLYDHSSSEWRMEETFTGGLSGYHWLRHTIMMPSPYFSPNGSIDVAITGMHSDEQNVGPVILTDQGHLYTDYISVNATSDGGLQYPNDVTLAFGDHSFTTLQGPLSGSVLLGDDHGLKTALQAAIDDEVVGSGNITIPLNISVSAITMGILEVRDLVIEYEPPTNGPPEWQGPGEVEVLEDSGWTEVLDLDSSFHDDHNQGLLDLELVEITDEVNLSVRFGRNQEDNRTLEVLPAKDFFGQVGVTVRAEDLFGAAALSPEVVVKVVQTPDRPHIQDPEDLEILEGVPWHLQVNVTDPDLPDDVLVFSIDEGPEGATIDGSMGVVSWSPGDDQVGRHTINVTVSDRFDLEYTTSFSVVVKNVNDAPLITSPLSLTSVQDVPVSYSITALDPDVPFGDQLSFSAFSEDIELTVVKDTGLLYFIPLNDHVPGFKIVIRVMDIMGDMGEEVLAVTVENVNDPPKLEQTGPFVFDQGEEVSIWLEVSDPDLGLDLPIPEQLSFNIDGPESLRPDKYGWINLTPGQPLVGEHRVTYTVTDNGGLMDDLTVTWTILDVNDPPVIDTKLDPPVYAFEDVEFILVLNATDPDGDIVIWSDDCDLFDIDSVTGRVAFTPLQRVVGRYPVTILVSDRHGGEAVLAFDLEVMGMNDPPIIHSILPKNGTRYREGETVTFAANATDEDDSSLEYLWTEGGRELGRGAVLKKGGISPGRHTITLVVTDGEHQVEETFVVIVNASEGIGRSVQVLVIIIVAIVLIVSIYLLRRKGEST
jgi:hypothetical protein